MISQRCLNHWSFREFNLQNPEFKIKETLLILKKL